MNILLISPPSNQFEKMYPLMLGGISSVLKKAGYDVFGMDLSFVDIDKCLKLIAHKRIDIIGISISYQNYKDVISNCSLIKSKFSLPIIAVGSYVTIMGKKLLQNEYQSINCLIMGESEIVFLEAVNAIAHAQSLQAVEGAIWRDGQNIIVNPPRSYCDSLDELPFSDRTLFPLKRYSGIICRNKRYTQIVTSKGCPHRCVYCFQYLAEPKRRERSPKNVVDEVEHLIQNCQVNEIHVEDANFISGNSERIKDICREIIRRKVKFDWQCAGVIPLAEIDDLFMLDLMAQAGCYNVSLGIESFHEMLTNRMGRQQSIQSLPHIINQCRKNGMEVSCHMMIGFPGQSIGQIRKDIQISRTYQFDFIHYNIFQDLPGTSIYKSHVVGDNLVPYLILKRIQRLAYLKLVLKVSVLKFLLRRFLKLNNIALIVRKIIYYLSAPQDVHVS